MKSINEIIWDFENGATTQDSHEMYCGGGGSDDGGGGGGGGPSAGTV